MVTARNARWDHMETDAALGGLIEAFDGRVATSWVVWFIFAAALAGGATGRPAGSLPLGLGVGLAAFTVPFLLLRRSAMRRRVEVYTNALVYRKRDKAEVWRWNEVDEFVVVSEEREIHTRPSSILEGLIEAVVEAAVKAILPAKAKYRVSYRLTGGGRKVNLTYTMKQHYRLGELAGEQIKAQRLPALQAALRTGETLHFGRYALGPSGLIDERAKQLKLLPWDALAGVSVSSHHVTIRQAGNQRAWATVPVGTVPNAQILSALVDRVKNADVAADMR